MNQVLDRLWIGSTEDFRAPLRSLGFVAVLDLRDSAAQVQDDSVAVLNLRNRDGDPWTPVEVNEALDFVLLHIRRGKVLVACAAGMSRSASMVIGFLVRTGWDVAAAFEAVRAARPRIVPMPKMLTSVLAAVRS